MSAVLASLIHFNLTNQCINQNKHAIKKPSFILKKIEQFTAVVFRNLRNLRKVCTQHCTTTTIIFVL